MTRDFDAEIVAEVMALSSGNREVQFIAFSRRLGDLAKAKMEAAKPRLLTAEEAADVWRNISKTKNWPPLEARWQAVLDAAHGRAFAVIEALPTAALRTTGGHPVTGEGSTTQRLVPLDAIRPALLSPDPLTKRD